MGSEHPVARAISTGAAEHATLIHPKEFQAVVGQGLSCTVAGKAVVIGNRMLMVNQRLKISDELENKLTQWEDQGKTAMLAAVEGSIVGILAVADTLKPEAKIAVQK